VRPRASSNSSSGGKNSSSGDSGSGNGPKRHRHRKAKQPGIFEVRVSTPPPRSLGVFELPPLTHTGDEVVIDGEGYVVQRLVLHYKLRGGERGCPSPGNGRGICWLWGVTA